MTKGASLKYSTEMKSVSIIPQLFYDIIGRIIPGVVLLLCIFMVYYGPENAAKLFTSLVGKKGEVVEVSFYLFLISGILSYVISNIAQGIRVIFSKKYKEHNREKWKQVLDDLGSDLEKAADNLGLNKKIKVEDIPSTGFIYDYIRLRSPSAGARIAKLRAECHMCSVFVTGMAGIAAWNLVNIIASPTKIEIIMELGFLASAFVFWMLRQFFEKRFYTALWNHWILLFSPLIKNENNTPG